MLGQEALCLSSDQALRVRRGEQGGSILVRLRHCPGIGGKHARSPFEVLDVLHQQNL